MAADSCWADYVHDRASSCRRRARQAGSLTHTSATRVAASDWQTHKPPVIQAATGDTSGGCRMLKAPGRTRERQVRPDSAGHACRSSPLHRGACVPGTAQCVK